MRSLTGQLMAWLMAVITVTAVLAGFATAYVSYNEQNRLLDDQLRQIALSVGDTPSAAGNASRVIAGVNPGDRIAVQIAAAGGQLIRQSDLSASIPIQDLTGFSEHLDGDILWRTFTLVTERRTIQVSQDTAVRTDIVSAAALNTILPIALLVPLSWVVVGLAVNRGMRPLGDFSRRLSASDGAERPKLPAEQLPRELKPLANAANTLLDRQHELLEMRETFISDAAHQLRTPIAGLLLQLQNLKHDLPQEISGELRNLETGLTRLSLLSAQLLNLARAEAPSSQHSFLRLSDAVRDALSSVINLADARSIDIGLTEEAEAWLAGETVDATMLIASLLDNAVRYTPPGGSVEVRITVRGGFCILTVSDTGPGIAEDELGQVFDRFHRGRQNAGDGSGLGLAIVAALARRLSATVELRNRETGGLEATVKFPSERPTA